MHKGERLDDHQKFRELCALAQGEEISASDRLELNTHLEVCDACREVFEEYSLLSGEGMSFLAAACGRTGEYGAWDEGEARHRLLSRVRENGRAVASVFKLVPGRVDAKPQPRFTGMRWAAALAACILVVVAIGMYHLGAKISTGARNSSGPAFVATSSAPAQNSASTQMLVSQASQIAQLQQEVSSKQKDLAKLREELHAADARASQLIGVSGAKEDQLRQISDQRSKLADQLHESEQAYQNIQAQLTDLRAERDRAVFQAASAQSKMDELTARTQDQERQLKDDEQYLASDRDIRELMGARKLYIADVFDVDSGSRTRKPFGRVFYTQSKSLIFYAFDLDHQPGVKNASAFQVWGQKDAELAEKARPMNLGILYMDSETNRRWVLRLEDPKQLEEIDAVFVTVEPHGGSQKPTGKPFLYALLRKEANHP